MTPETMAMSDIEAVIDRHRNELLVPDAVLETFMTPARAFALLSTGSGFAISPADLADLVAVKERTLGLLAGWFDRLIAMTEERRRNLVRYDGIGVVSLGCDCVSRAVLARWGLKKTAKLGEKSGPFDLAVHPPETVSALLADDFSGYLDPDQLAYREADAICIHPRYQVSFNHEVGPDYAADGFRTLRDIYAARIANLRAALADPRPLGLVVHVPHFIDLSPGRVDCLKRTLDQIAAGRRPPTSMIVVNSYVPGQPDAAEEQETEAFLLRHVPMPGADYVWHWPQCYMSEAGQDYERRLVAIVAERFDRLAAAAV
jgi:hypothetical protein